MKLAELIEGAMKRSDPYISGERSGPRPADSAHMAQMKSLAAKANVPLQDVQAAWEKAKGTTDRTMENRWKIVMHKTKRELGLVEGALTELFDKFNPKDMHVHRQDEDGYTVYTTFGKNRTIVFKAIKREDMHGADWALEFASVHKGSTSYHMTADGDEFKVMQFVMTCMKDFVKLYDPNMIVFTTDKDEVSREKLYDRLIARFGKDFVVHKSSESTMTSKVTLIHKRVSPAEIKEELLAEGYRMRLVQKGSIPDSKLPT